jgi:hypothetical protein
MLESIKSRLNDLRQQLPQMVTLVAVSKTHPVERIHDAYDAGQRIFGENRVQELTSKYEALPKDIEWHMVGHLQSNKIKYIAPFVNLIHSIDSEKLIQEVNKQAEKCNRVIDILLQVFIAKEETKFGFLPDEVKLFFNASASQYKYVRIRGLMGMATNTPDTIQIKNEFKDLANLYTQLKASQPDYFSILSMGMSSDWQLAVEQGSTMIRVGSTLFGSRN